LSINRIITEFTKTTYIIFQIRNKLENKLYRGFQSGKSLTFKKLRTPGNQKLIDDYRRLGFKNFEKTLLYETTNKEDFLKHKKELISLEFKKNNTAYTSTLGYVQVLDSIGKKLRVQRDDPRYLSGELINFSIGKLAVKDKTGNAFQVSKTDPRFINGELKAIAKGKVCVKDKEGKTKQVDINDPQYLNGELTFISTDSKYSKEAIKKVTAAQHNRRVLERQNIFPKFTHNIKPNSNNYLIKNYCEHGDLIIEQRFFKKLYNHKNDVKIYCKQCLDTYINNYIPTDKDYIKYRDICNILFVKQIRYLFDMVFLKYFNPNLYKCILQFNENHGDITWIQKYIILDIILKKTPHVYKKIVSNILDIQQVIRDIIYIVINIYYIILHLLEKIKFMNI